MSSWYNSPSCEAGTRNGKKLHRAVGCSQVSLVLRLLWNFTLSGAESNVCWNTSVQAEVSRFHPTVFRTGSPYSWQFLSLFVFIVVVTDSSWITHYVKLFQHFTEMWDFWLCYALCCLPELVISTLLKSSADFYSTHCWERHARAMVLITDSGARSLGWKHGAIISALRPQANCLPSLRQIHL